MKVRKQWRQCKTKDMMKGIVTVLLCTGVLCFSVLAEEESGPKSNVWLDVIQVPTEAHISVTVPLSYGFAVIGSVESSDEHPVSVENGNLLLPNIRVVVTEGKESGTLPGAAGSAEYFIQTVGPSLSSFPLRNYSTDVRDEYADEDEDIPPREGLPVEVKPYMIAPLGWDEDFNPIPIHYWEPSLTDPTWDGIATETNFKKFQMSLDNMPFSEMGSKSVSTKFSDGTVNNATWDGVIWLKDYATIALDAPPDVPNYGYTSDGAAKVPSEKYISVQVKVGGKQNEYKQVEQSVKVGTIYWEVLPGELPAVTEP